MVPFSVGYRVEARQTVYTDALLRRDATIDSAWNTALRGIPLCVEYRERESC